MQCRSALPFIALALSLTACGGDKGSSPPPPDNPPPTGTPTPTPPPISYTKFADLTGNQSFDSACAGSFNANEPLLSSGFGSYPDSYASLNIDYVAATQTYTVEGGTDVQFSYSFGPGDLDANSSASSILYRKVDENGFTTRFGIGARSLGGAMPEYVRTARLFARPSSSVSDLYCVFGVPTQLNDALPATTISYASFALTGNMFVRSGDLAGQYDLGESTVTMTANPTNGEIRTRMTLIGRRFEQGGLSQTRTPLGVYLGEASIDGSQASFVGGVFGDDRAVGASNFGGWFFGPSGKEAGYAFALTAFTPDTSDEMLATGAVIARR